MMKLYHIFYFLFIFFWSLCLSGCGQTGSLYLPGQPSIDGPPYYSIWHPADHLKWVEQQQDKDMTGKESRHLTNANANSSKP